MRSLPWVETCATRDFPQQQQQLNNNSTTTTTSSTVPKSAAQGATFSSKIYMAFEYLHTIISVPGTQSLKMLGTCNTRDLDNVLLGSGRISQEVVVRFNQGGTLPLGIGIGPSAGGARVVSVSPKSSG